MNTPSYQLKRLFFAGLTICVLLGSSPWAMAMPSKVAVLPFQMNTEKEMAYLQQGIFDMLVSRLSWEDRVSVLSLEDVREATASISGPVTETISRKIGHSLGVDYVLFGSLTIFGNSVSVDAKMVDMAQKRPTLAFFNQSQGMDEVIPRINQFAGEINQKVFGRQVAVQSLPRPAQTREQPGIYAHPERLVPGGVYGAGGSAFVRLQGDESAGFWKSRSLKIRARGLTLGDVDGDGHTETVVISSLKVLLFRSLQQRFQKIGEYEAKSQHRLVSVDAADINNNGKAELFITAINATTLALNSFVLEWAGSGLTLVADSQRWYYRVVTHPDQGPMLVGQRRGVNELFYPGVYELGWKNNQYVKMAKLSLPGVALVYGFSIGDVMNNNKEMVLAFDSAERVRIYSSGGKMEWRSAESFGGSENFLLESKGSEDRFYLPQRIFITDLNNNGKNEVIIAKNTSITGRMFKRFRRYTNGQIESFSWNGLGLARFWHTRKVSGHISDFNVGDIDNDGKPELSAVVVSGRGEFLQDAKSSVIVYDLDNLFSEDPT